MTKMLSAALGLFLAFTVHANEVKTEGAKLGQWTMDYDAALKLAKSSKQPMVLNFTGSDWCGWCKIMDKNVFAKDEWKKYAAKNAVLVTLDFPRDKSIVPAAFVSRNNELKKKFGIRGYPTYVIVDSDGSTVLGRLGAGRDKTPSSFIDEFKNTVRMSSTAVDAFAKQNPGKAKAYAAAIKEFKDSKKALSDWIATKPKRNEENDKKYQAFKARIAKAQKGLNDF